MILQSLVTLAEREGLVENEAYETKDIHWRINVKPDGRYISFESLLQYDLIPVKKKKPKPRGRSSLVPRPFPGARQTGTKPDAGFLHGNSSFVLELDLSKEHKYSKRELNRRRGEFSKLIQSAIDKVTDRGLRSVLDFLSSSGDFEKAKKAAAAKFDAGELFSNHLIAFCLYSDTNPFVHLRPKLIKYWNDLRAKMADKQSADQCLITGRIAPSIDKHPPLKRVPGGTPSGVALVSFNEDAFESYGLKRNKNAPVCRPAAEAYTTAINRLLDPTYLDPHNPSIRLPEQRVQLSNDTVAVFWTDTSSRIPAAIVPAVGEGEPEAIKKFGISLGLHESWSEIQGEKEEQISPEPVRRTFRAPWEGEGIKSYELKDTHAFRLLILSGTQGRAIVRAFHSSRICDTVNAVKNWFDDIRISTLKGKPALWRLINSLALRRDRANLSPNLSSRVFLSILNGKELPHEVLETAIRRCRSEPNSRQIGARLIGDQKVTPERAALIKAYLNRQRRRQASPDYISYLEVKPMLNEEERNRGYLLGRMFACVERMQELALGEVGASVTDRFFSGACATPQAVFPRLLKNEIHHYGKAREGKWAGNARWVHGIISQLAVWLVGSENGMQKDETIERFLKRTVGRPLKGFPAFLPLPEQGLFTLGYHQQRAEFFRPKQKNELNQPV